MARPRLRPVRWHPPKAPGLTGSFRPNHALRYLERIEMPGTGPEDIAVDAQGRLFTGLADGQIIRFDVSPPTVVANTSGRPLGIECAAKGHLIICDAERGLLKVNPDTGEVTVLVAEVAGEPLMVANNASIASDGTIYFSQSSTKFTLDQLKGDLLEHGGHGRLLRRNPDGQVEVLLTDLQFANGVALAPDESFVLVAETGAYRIRRLWLTGEHAGHDEILIDNLPGFPDNICLAPDGVFWVALPSERNALLDRLHNAPGFLRHVVWWLPDRFQPDASRIGLIFSIDSNGEVHKVLHGDGHAFHYITGMRQHGDVLYVGSLMESAVGRVRLAKLDE